jgi:hypothetical protein
LLNRIVATLGVLYFLKIVGLVVCCGHLLVAERLAHMLEFANMEVCQWMWRFAVEVKQDKHGSCPSEPYHGRFVYTVSS